MKFFLAFLLWIFGGAGVENPNTSPRQFEAHNETVGVQTQDSGIERVHYTGRRTIIVLDDTQFRPKK
ncbi:MAG: hypothetical protein AAF927_13905 [Bacteroidota bacterium]